MKNRGEQSPWRGGARRAAIVDVRICLFENMRYSCVVCLVRLKESIFMGNIVFLKENKVMKHVILAIGVFLVVLSLTLFLFFVFRVENFTYFGPAFS